MFDIGWSEVLVIATVAIVVVGPKDLPRMLRTFGKTMGTVRRTANDFKRQFDDALREAEREVDLADTRKELKAMVADPLAETKRDFDKTMRDAARDPSAKPVSGTLATAGEPPVVPSATEAVHPAAPLKGADPGSETTSAAKPDAAKSDAT
jgi:sec-independent protein translocase protein TatB